MKFLIKIALVATMLTSSAFALEGISVNNTMYQMTKSSDRDPTLEKNVVVVFDDSGSMDGIFNSRIKRARQATRALVSSLDVNTNLGIIALNKGVIHPLSKIGKHSNFINSKVDNIRANGGTYIGATLSKVQKMIVKQRKLQAGYGEYIIVIVTDGEANDSSLMYRKVDELTKNGFIIKTIGLDLTRHKLQDVTGFVSASSTNQLISAMKKAVNPEIKSIDKFMVQDF